MIVVPQYERHTLPTVTAASKSHAAGAVDRMEWFAYHLLDCWAGEDPQGVVGEIGGHWA